MVGVLRAATEEERAAKADETLAAMAQLEKAFAEVAAKNGKPFFGGDTVGYVDLALGCNLHFLEAIRRLHGVALVDAGKTPLLAAWAERFLAVDAVRQVMPDAGDVLKQYKGFLAKWTAGAGSS
jgi:glutathione S-transferase